jgi:hypothetical protein
MLIGPQHFKRSRRLEAFALPRQMIGDRANGQEPICEREDASNGGTGSAFPNDTYIFKLKGEWKEKLTHGDRAVPYHSSVGP